jgi:cytochrome c2
MKFLLAGVVLILLFLTASAATSNKEGNMKTVLLYGLCLITVAGLGYFGGELVYGQKVPSGKPDDSLIRQGAVVFNASCSACHYADKTESKIGPGLKGIFQKDKLPTSGWSTTETNVRKQLKTPYKNMPPFANLPEENLNALIAYLKTL